MLVVSLPPLTSLTGEHMIKPGQNTEEISETSGEKRTPAVVWPGTARLVCQVGCAKPPLGGASQMPVSLLMLTQLLRPPPPPIMPMLVISCAVSQEVIPSQKLPKSLPSATQAKPHSCASFHPCSGIYLMAEPPVEPLLLFQ